MTVAPATGLTRPVTVAESVIGEPTGTFGDAIVVIAGLALETVIPVEVPRALAVRTPERWVLSTIWTVWTPAVPGSWSMTGTLSTSKTKLIRQIAPVPVSVTWAPP